MRTRLIGNLLRATRVCLLSITLVLPAAAAELGAQKSTNRGVTVTVTPQNLSRGAKTWDFKVVLDTHSTELSDNLVKTTVLLDGTGGRYTPVAWDGAAPGGHHREGVLRFKPLAAQPQAIELQIMRPGESAPRLFRWQLK